MRGELKNVWPEAWTEIFVPLSNYSVAPVDLYNELYVALIEAPVSPTLPKMPEAFTEDGEIKKASDIQAQDAYRAALARYATERDLYEQIRTGTIDASEQLADAFLAAGGWNEARALKALLTSFQVLDELAGDELSNYFYVLVERFLLKFSLRYDLRRPFSLHPTLPGIFARLVSDLRAACQVDVHLCSSLREFEESLRDLTADRSARQIKTCIAKQTNFLEAIAANNNVNTLGRICDGLKTWPHHEVKESVKRLYKFASDYPNIRHGGTAGSNLREIDMRDLVAMSVVLFGFMPYLTDKINAETIYAITESAQ